MFYDYRLFCGILNFAPSLGIFSVRPDCFLVRSGLVSDLTNNLFMKKNYLQPWEVKGLYTYESQRGTPHSPCASADCVPFSCFLVTVLL